jgi:hypothetical protein
LFFSALCSSLFAPCSDALTHHASYLFTYARALSHFPERFSPLTLLLTSVY